MRGFAGRDILSLKDMKRDDYFQIFGAADRLVPHAAERRNGDLLKSKTLLTAFYQDTLDGLKVLCVGDMRMRTMHSILYAMSQFDMEAFVVSPPEMSLLDEFKTELDERNVLYREVESVEKCIADADVIYMEPVVQADYTQARVEAGGERGMTPAAYRVTRELLRDNAKSSAIILHSLPRMDELPPDVDSTRHNRYWYEAFNGVVMRMVLLSLALGAIE